LAVNFVEPFLKEEKLARANLHNEDRRGFKKLAKKIWLDLALHFVEPFLKVEKN